MAQLAETIETPRLLIRNFESGDLDVLAEILGDESVNRFLYTQARTHDESVAALATRMSTSGEDDEDQLLRVAVELKDPRVLIGDFMLRWRNDVHRQGEFGGSLHPRYHGQGFATEVYRGLLELAFDRHDLHRVYGQCDARNIASVRSLEKAGLRREAHLVENEYVKGEWTDEIVLAILQREWRATESPRSAAHA
jgi:RimJ/RimL family protein N-acetyltransferase